MARYPYEKPGTQLDEFRENLIKTQEDVAADINDVANGVAAAVQAAKQVTGLIWLEPVASFSALATTYPDAILSNAAMATDTGKVYRFNGKAWEYIQQIDAGPVNALATATALELAEKAKKTEVRKDTITQPINVSEMDTETKKLFTGGSVAVVGENAVGPENLKEKAVLKEALGDGVKNAIFGAIKFSYELGSLDSEDGSNSLYTSRIRMTQKELSKGETTIHFSDDGTTFYNVFLFDEAQNFIQATGWITAAKYTIPDNRYFNIVARFVDSRAILPEDYATLLNKLVIDMPKWVAIERDLKDNKDVVSGIKKTIEEGGMIAVNELRNADFSEGGLYWNYNGTVTAADGVLTLTANNSIKDPRIIPEYEQLPEDGRIIYMAAEMRVLNDDCLFLAMRSDYGGGTQQTINEPVNGQWYRLSGMITKNGETLFPRIAADYGTTAAANGKQAEYRKPIVIDVTKTFGAGKEPDKQTIEHYLSYLQEGWFNDFANLVNVRTIKDDFDAYMKANGGGNVVNKVNNSDFSDGLGNFNVSGTATAKDGVLTQTANGGRNDPRIYPSGLSFPVGHKVYFSGEIQVNDDDCTDLILRIDYSATTLARVRTIKKGSWHRLSGIHTVKESDTVFGRMSVIYPDAATAAGKVIMHRKPFAIDLTEAFGAGNEPSYSAVTGLLEDYGGWYEGSESLMNTKTVFNQLTRLTKDIENESEKVLDYPEFMFSAKLENSGYMADHCIVGNELWQFQSTADDIHQAVADVNRFSIDFETQEITRVGSFSHNWGHVNSIDYCKETDTLICGSGSGSYTNPTEIFLFPNASALANLTSAPLEEYALVINVDAENWGAKANVVWGQSNGGRFNICHVVTNDNRNIRKVLLGQGAAALEGGQLIEGKIGLEFNGTFKVLKEYEYTDGLDVIQGCTFYGGYLIHTLGHARYWIFTSRLNENGAIERTQYIDRRYDELGEEVTNPYSSGVEVYKGYLLNGTSDGFMRVYKWPY